MSLQVFRAVFYFKLQKQKLNQLSNLNQPLSLLFAH
jgi:hypothetical protein